MAEEVAMFNRELEALLERSRQGYQERQQTLEKIRKDRERLEAKMDRLGVKPYLSR